MCRTFRINSLLLMCVVLSTVLLTNAFETYSETDQLAEESIGGDDKEGHQETTTNANQISSIKESNIMNERQSVKDSSAEDDPIDPLQKILPKVKFNCKGKSEGYYADKEFCEVFHYCKTNGFRFTFMCPPESYYNDKLMACEFNSTLSKCVEREKNNKTQNKVLSPIKETSLNTSSQQNIEILEKSSSHINTNTEMSSTEPTKAADPYLTRRKNHYSFRSLPTEVNKTKAENVSQNQTLSESKENITQTILPFSGFRKFNRNKTQMKIKSNTQSESQQNHQNQNTRTNSSDSSLRIPSNALPVLKSLRPQIISNSNQMKNYRNKSWSKTGTTTTSTTSTSTTTTPHPSLISPSVKERTTSSPFDYFTPIFNSDTNFPLNSEFFPLSMHKKPENTAKDNSNQRKSLMTQNYYNSIRHTTRRPNFDKESQIEETLKQSESNSEYSSYIPSEENQFNGDTHLSESQIHELIEKLKQIERHQNLDTNFQNSDYSEAESSIEPMENINESVHIGSRQRREKNKPKQFLTVPVLVPTGVSKSDLRRKLSSTLLKPTVLPLTENGDEMPAYVLQFQNSDITKKSKNNKQRSKRQAFGWNSYYSNPFSRQTYYIPMNSMSSMSAPIYSPFNNHMRHSVPMSRHLEIGDRPGFSINPSAQQHIPYYIPRKQPFIGNNFIGNNLLRENVYDLSEFSDFYENPFNNKGIPFTSNDMSPYRSVSLRRPGFRRPPRRERIPDTKKDVDNNTTEKNDTKTTARPFNSVPVSPRPYSQPLAKQQYYARNSNPFSDFSDQTISEAIRAFDGSDDNLQSFDPDFVSQPLFPFNSPQISNDFIPMTPKTPSDTLNGRSSRISKYSEIPFNSYVSDDFPPLPKFGDPDYRLPYIDIPDPTLTNFIHRSNPYNNWNNESVRRKQDNNTRYSTPYSPEVIYSENQNSNETERNPNHNYDNVDKGELQTARTVDDIHNLRQILKPSLNWENIVGQYHKQNVSLNSKPQITGNKNDSNEQKESENSKIQKYVSYGTRLNRNSNKFTQNPEISVKSSISSISSLQSEASDQIVITRKLGTDSDLSSQAVNDSKEKSKDKNIEKSIDELYNQRAFDRLLLFNYYNHLNSLKSKSTTTTTTTTVSPLDGKYPSTAHWSIRGWTGQFYPKSNKITNVTTTPITTTPTPIITAKSNIEFIDLFESETKNSETTTELPPETTTTEIPDPPYKRVFNSQMGATFHSNKYSKPYSVSVSQKTRSDISNYLSSLTLSP